MEKSPGSPMSKMFGRLFSKHRETKENKSRPNADNSHPKQSNSPKPPPPTAPLPKSSSPNSPSPKTSPPNSPSPKAAPPSSPSPKAAPPNSSSQKTSPPNSPLPKTSQSPPSRSNRVWIDKPKYADFKVGTCLGTGSFGRVHLAHYIPTNQLCAIKSLSKASILKMKQVVHVKQEKGILKEVDFPFIVNLIGYCQDDKYIHLIMEFVCGGEFFTYLRTTGRFDEPTARFYATQVLMSFDYLHNMDIIYRDLKPENLLLDEKGNLKITDFGFAKKIDRRTYTLCGTPDYLAPEIILNKGHGKPVDWFPDPYFRHPPPI